MPLAYTPQGGATGQTLALPKPPNDVPLTVAAAEVGRSGGGPRRQRCSGEWMRWSTPSDVGTTTTGRSSAEAKVAPLVLRGQWLPLVTSWPGWCPVRVVEMILSGDMAVEACGFGDLLGTLNRVLSAALSRRGILAQVALAFGCGLARAGAARQGEWRGHGRRRGCLLICCSDRRCGVLLVLLEYWRWS